MVSTELPVVFALPYKGMTCQASMKTDFTIDLICYPDRFLLLTLGCFPSQCRDLSSKTIIEAAEPMHIQVSCGGTFCM